MALLLLLLLLQMVLLLLRLRALPLLLQILQLPLLLVRTDPRCCYVQQLLPWLPLTRHQSAAWTGCCCLPHYHPKLGLQMLSPLPVLALPAEKALHCCWEPAAGYSADSAAAKILQACHAGGCGLLQKMLALPSTAGALAMVLTAPVHLRPAQKLQLPHLLLLLLRQSLQARVLQAAQSYELRS
jgi:hypothetical protein